MDWLAEALKKYPELAVYLVVGLGYAFGSLKIRGFGLGAVTGSLLAGLVLGYCVEIPVSAMSKSFLFLMFLFSIGYSVGPRFFATMKGDGLRWVALAAVQCTVGLITAVAVAKFLHLDPGFSGGLLSGGLTQSAAMGTASEAIRTLPMSEADHERLVAHVAVADALCYVFGTLIVIVFCTLIAPRLIRADLRAEAEKVEKAMGIDRSKPNVVSAWRPFEMRAYRLAPGGAAAGKSVAECEAMLPDARVFIERIRRDGALIDPTPQTVLREGDLVVASGRREVLVKILGALPGGEVEDPELLDIPTAAYDVYLTRKEIAGRTLEDIARSTPELRGVFLREIQRGDEKIPLAPSTVVQRGDILRVSGPEPAVLRAEPLIGKKIAPSDDTDFVALGLAIVIGALLGIAIVIPLGSIRIPLGTSVGVLVAGLLVGYLRSVRPLFARIPDGAISLMMSLGLASFVGMVGIGAGPHFVQALRDAGVGLLVGGMVVTIVPLVVALYFGRYVLKLNPVLLLGGIAGAQTVTAAMAAVQERSGSPVAVLGYSGTVAVGNILLTVWGSLIVRMMA